MKHFFTIIAAVSLLIFTGCTKPPEEAAKAHFDETIGKVAGLKTTNFKITKISQEKDKAVLKVEADLNYLKDLSLVKENGEWVVK